MSNDDYSEILEGISKTYAPKALAFLTRVRDLLVREYLIIQADPYDMTDDDYRWCLIVHRNPGRDLKRIVDITVEIAEQRACDGGEGYGINFMVDITEWSGRMLGGIAPYNYTPQCWVDARDPLAVAARWRLIEDSDIGTIPSLITDGYERKGDGYYRNAQ